MKTPLASILWRSLRAFQVFGANTGVGKTVFTTILGRTARRLWQDENVAVLKPVSTGSHEEADERCKRALPHEHDLTKRKMVQGEVKIITRYAERHFEKFAPGVAVKTLFQYDLPLSPHLAAQISGRTIPSDDAVLNSCRAFAAQRSAGKGWLFLETAGGVHSPGPSGTTQADLYAPLRLPTVLVGDHGLGGISQTIAAFESLRMRGYDVESVLLFDEDHKRYENLPYLSQYFAEKHGIPVFGTKEPPVRGGDDVKAMEAYYEEKSRETGIANMLRHLKRQHEERIERLESMADKAHQSIWYPFTQQKHVSPSDITVIDSASGDYFQTLNRGSSLDASLLRASFDGSASWWTQGLGHANPKLTLAAAYAAGRYGHVMFASAVHEPALALAETLLQGMRNPRLSRVFYSDNGSTGVEVALKMGLGAARKRYGWEADEKLGVLGLRGGYHGDTIGAMDCAEPSCFNEKVEWYDGSRGYWVDYPTVACVDGRWRVDVPDAIGAPTDFAFLEEVFDVESREQRGEHVAYEKFILKTLENLQAQGRRFGALITEPVVLGAGGMALADPLFQRTLVNVVRRSPHLFGKPGVTPVADERETSWTGLPIIFDEVFTGLYRLGRFSSSSFLGVDADISVHAKLLTGGLLPLCATLASESIFDAFSSDDKADALLHGHSYTAHPVGCQVALASLRELRTQQHEEDGNWSIWPHSLVDGLSRDEGRVMAVWALGSVLAIHLRGEDGAARGYSSDGAAVRLREELALGDAEAANGPWNVHCRVLGNVLYLMAGQTTTRASIDQIGRLLERRID